MAVRLDQREPDFEERFSAFLTTKREVSQDVDAVVRDIIARVRAEGDAALIDYSAQFDGIDLDDTGIRVAATEIEAARRQADPHTLAALVHAHERITVHHMRQKPKDDRYTDALGVVSTRTRDGRTQPMERRTEVVSHLD